MNRMPIKSIVIMLFVLFVISFASIAFAESSEEFTYDTLPDGSVRITNYTGSSLSILIPDTLDGKPVTTIGERAFRYSKISDITIPGSVKSVELKAFLGCDCLESVSFQNSDESLEIDEYAFDGNSALVTVEIGAKNIIFNERAFRYCSSLQTINFTNNPNTISIGEKAFLECKGLLTFETPDTLLSLEIGDYAFDGDTALQKIHLSGESVILGERAFRYCDAIKEVIFADNVKTIQINDKAFLECNGLVDFIVPETVIDCSIGAYAFDGDENLSVVSLGSGNVSIGERSFRYCESLTQLLIPNGNVSIGDKAFLGCDSLILYGKSESSIEQYAKDNKIMFADTTAYVPAFIESFDVTNQEITEKNQSSEIAEMDSTEITTHELNLDSDNTSNLTNTEEPIVIDEEPVSENPEWICPVCGANCTGNFCNSCGNPKPVDDEYWICINCGNTASGNFCNNCGTSKETSLQNEVFTEQKEIIELESDGIEPVTEPSISSYNIAFSIDSLVNLVFAKYEIEIYIDNNYVETIKNSELSEFSYELLEGIHNIHVNSADDPNVYGDFVFVVSGTGSIECRITSHLANITFDKYTLEGELVRASDDAAVEYLDHSIELNDIDNTVVEPELLQDSEEETIQQDVEIQETESTTGEESKKELTTEEEPIIEEEPTTEEPTTEEPTTEEIKQEESEYKDTKLDINDLEVIKQVQEKLNELGFNCGIADGIAGAMTQAAISQYEESIYLPVTGQITAKLLNYLGLEFDQEVAERVAVTAVTNYFSKDIYAGDGISFDYSKFHTYKESVEGLVEVVDPGEWIKINDDIWYVDGLIIRNCKTSSEFIFSMDLIHENDLYYISDLIDETNPDEVSFLKLNDACYVTPKLIDEDYTIETAIEPLIEPETTTSKPQEQETTTAKKTNPASYHSSNDADIAKKGNSGVYAYKNRGGAYDVYYIIDFDEGYVYYFCDGNGDTYVDVGKLTSGDLNSVVIVTYKDGDLVWQEGLRFNWKNQPDHLIMQDERGSTYDFYTTNLSNALRLKNTKNLWILY